MSTESKAVELEIVEDEKLVKYADNTGLEKPATSALVAAFHPIFAKARLAIAEAQGVAESVKDATCMKEIRKSRACRLALREIRIESDKTRKTQKEHALLYGRAVDGFHAILLADLSPVESALQEAEDIAERAEANRLASLRLSREAELQPFLETPIMGDLSAISEKDYTTMLSDAKLLKQAKVDAAAKAEADAKAKAEADRLERERIAAENANLKAEAEAREAAAKAEREEAARKLAAESIAANIELAKERKAAEAARKAAEAVARKEREAIESKAKAEREAAEAEAKKERLRLQALAEVERQKTAAAEAAAKALRDAEAKKAAEAAAAAKKAAAAPDNAKAQVFADSLRNIPLPTFQNTKAFASLAPKIEAIALWIESQIKSNGELI